MCSGHVEVLLLRILRSVHTGWSISVCLFWTIFHYLICGVPFQKNKHVLFPLLRRALVYPQKCTKRPDFPQ